jgi:UDP-glucose 4-epimerase
VVVLDNLSTGFRSAVPDGVPLILGDFGDEDLVTELLAKHAIEAIIHFAAKIVVPESVADPLGYYLNNTAMARTLLACAVDCGVKHFIFSSTAAVYGEPAHVPVSETESLKPMSPYGRSKLMVEWMLEDTAKAHDLSYVVLRYFNVAGADPQGRIGQSTPNATHLIKVAVQTALGRRQAWRCSARILRRPTAGACAIRSRSPIWHARMSNYPAPGGGNLTSNVDYARGYFRA